MLITLRSQMLVNEALNVNRPTEGVFVFWLCSVLWLVICRYCVIGLPKEEIPDAARHHGEPFQPLSLGDAQPFQPVSLGDALPFDSSLASPTPSHLPSPQE